MRLMIFFLLLLILSFSVSAAEIISVDTGLFNSEVDYRWNQDHWETRGTRLRDWVPVNNLGIINTALYSSEYQDIAKVLVVSNEREGLIYFKRISDGFEFSGERLEVTGNLNLPPEQVPAVPLSPSSAQALPLSQAQKGTGTAQVRDKSDAPDILKQQNLCNTSTCKEIDNVWLRVSPFLSRLDSVFRGKTWNFGVWTIGTQQQEQKPTTTQPSSPSQPIGNLKQKIVASAIAEETKWQGKNENDLMVKQYLRNYFNAGFCGSWASVEGDVTDWSAAFVSYVLSQATDNFAGSCSHVKYFHTHRISPAVCKSIPITEINNIQPGDILCSCRGGSCPLNFNVVPERNDQDTVRAEIAHCDIVVNKFGSRLDVIGGNLGHKVAKRPVDLGNIKNPPYFGYISCG